MVKSGAVIVWFRDDLRLSDHPALHAAAQTRTPLICLYVLDEESPQLRSPPWRPLGAASKWWLAQSLRSLDNELRLRGSRLILRRGSAMEVIPKLAHETGAAAVYWNKVPIGPLAGVANAVGDALQAQGIAVHRGRADLLANPLSIRSKDGRGLQVFTPFRTRLRALGDPAAPLPVPESLGPPSSVASDILEDWKLEPTHPDWAGGLRESWKAGEVQAQTALQAFLGDRAATYRDGRDRMDTIGTSRLSPYLRFGELSPRQVWHAARFAADQQTALGPALDKFVSELTWREFCRHQLYDHPDLHGRPLQASFEAMPWRDDPAALRAWQRGRTGYPIVDAGMRELWRTGVMHNRVRMVAASFLVKHLLIDWREGERRFWETLVDADPGSNPANWQWVAGCGADAAPFFRIFNPVLQGEKFDPNGAYVKRWIPELGGLPPGIVHRPWAASPEQLRDASVVLGTTYPEPIVEHRAARERALKAFRSLRSG